MFGSLLTYTPGMKTWVLFVTLALSPAAAFAQDGLAGPASETVRAGLLKEIEAYRATLLPQTESGPPGAGTRLDELKASVAAAETDAALATTRTNFEIWKIVVLRRLFAEMNRVAPGIEEYGSFQERMTAQADVVMAMRQQLAAQRVETQAAAVRALSMDAQTMPHEWDDYFDGSSSGNGGAVSAAAPRAADDPARYAKVRQIMISQGARPGIVDAAIKEALRQGVDPALVLSMIWQESKFRPGVTSRAGARGLMQIMPGTGRDMGVSNPNMLYDAQTNLRAGIKYLRWMADYLKLNVNLSDITAVPLNKLKALLASNNAGVGNVTKWLKRQGQDLTRIPFNETRHYVRVVGDKLARLVGCMTRISASAGPGSHLRR